MEHILLAGIQLPPDSREHRHKIFIVDHPCCNVLFDMGMEHSIFDMDDEKLFNPALWKDNADISQRFSDTVNRLVASGKTTVFMQYQPDILRAMGDLAVEMQKKLGDVWVFIAFFHNDQDTVFMNNPMQGTDSQREKALEQKAEWILTLGQFPFVKMVEIKSSKIIQPKMIQELFTEYAAVR